MRKSKRKVSIRTFQSESYLGYLPLSDRIKRVKNIDLNQEPFFRNFPKKELKISVRQLRLHELNPSSKLHCIEGGLGRPIVMMEEPVSPFLPD